MTDFVIPDLRDGGTVVRPGGVEIPYAVAGPSDGRRLLFAHSLLASGLGAAVFFTPMIDAGWQVAAVDQRSHGAASLITDPAGIALPEMADDLIAVLDALGWQSAWFFGASMGAATTLSAALAHPGRVDGVVLLSPAFGRTVNVTADRFRAIGAAFIEGGIDEGVAAWREMFAALGSGDAELDYHETQLRAMGAKSAGHLLCEVMGWTVDIDAVGDLDVPVGVLSWDGDEIHPLALGEEIASLAPRGHFEAVSPADPMTLFQTATKMLTQISGGNEQC